MENCKMRNKIPFYKTITLFWQQLWENVCSCSVSNKFTQLPLTWEEKFSHTLAQNKKKLSKCLCEASEVYIMGPSLPILYAGWYTKIQKTAPKSNVEIPNFSSKKSLKNSQNIPKSTDNKFANSSICYYYGLMQHGWCLMDMQVIDTPMIVLPLATGNPSSHNEPL